MTAKNKPNLLLVFADQMRGMDMRCAGNDQMITPNMDRLAAQGVMCSRAYANTPLCSPNRATLFTGTYPATHGITHNDLQVRTDLPSLGTVTKAAGYHSGYIGKWHIDATGRDKPIPSGPRRLGFDDYWSVYNCRHLYDTAEYYQGDSETLIVENRYEPTVQTDKAIQCMQQAVARNQPFCTALSWGPPHNPYELAPDEYRAMYPPPEQLRMRDNCEHIPENFLDPAWSHGPTTRDYWALITSLDHELGRLLDTLDQLGQADNTIVVFTSDHGDMLWSQGLLYKNVPYEESIHVPLLMRWPDGLSPEMVCDSLIGTADLLPSLLSLMGLETPASIEGMDLSQAIRCETQGERTAVPIASYRPYIFRKDRPTPAWRGVRTDQYTYAHTDAGEPWLLYDNKADPYQLNNLINSPTYESLRNKLAKTTRTLVHEPAN